MATITIGGRSVDPSSGMQIRLTRSDAAPTPRWALIQVRRSLGASERQDLEDLGVVVREYVPRDTYLCSCGPDALPSIASLPFVTWVGPYLPGLKVPVSLDPGATDRLSLADAARGPRPHRIRSQRAVYVALHDDADPWVVGEEVARAAGASPQIGRHKLEVHVSLERIPDIAAIEGVRRIEEVPAVQLHSDVARPLVGAVGDPRITLGYDGEGEIVAVADTGIDATHPSLAGRVRRAVALGRPGDASDPSGHGTAVACLFVGGADSPVLGARIGGVAPAARLVVQSLADPAGELSGLPHDLRDLLADPYAADGARVHCYAWGLGAGDGRYSLQSRELDAFVWDHPDCVVCVAAGNDGSDAGGSGVVGPRSLTPPATARNCIAVGASENRRPAFTLTYGAAWPGRFPAAPLFEDRTADRPDGVAAFSSRGPTVDGRLKPDIVAPGTFVLTALAAGASPDWGACADPQYAYAGGTSVAAPLVAGGCVLIRQWLVAHGVPRPSAALVKAMLLNGARDLPGQYTPSEAPSTPNHAEGFGRMDLEATVGPRAANLVLYRDVPALADGESFEFRLTLPTNGGRLKVTLVWTDPPGDTLQNDLDLIVISGASERHGNVAIGATDFDRTNNVEQVDWTGLPPGQVIVRVVPYRILQPQPFALVIRA